MRKTKQAVYWALALAALGVAGRAQAASTTAQLSISVTINATKSVSVVGAVSSTQTTSTSWDGSQTEFVAASTVVVVNDSHIINEQWKLQTLNRAYDSSSGAQSWTIATSSINLATDNVAVQAVFGSSNATLGSCTGLTDVTWGNGTQAAPLSTTPQTYGNGSALVAAENLATTASAGGSNAPDSGTTMYGDHQANGGKRALCWRLTMPNSTSYSGTQIVPIIVTAF